ncbi:histidinol-phosphate aminotransferase [Desulfofarcimen acetoxidans DSM 771]|uniref:Histidinol-phosphate aminotransferase n=1 Tax=Desulfofarcimen acetoxidans (strain ATCC 49208 / DSM 771 / KCTC 5769 / VKM B-1644 / 5575) TaxID=485916 RepID=C8W352_DESAS|nr:histidinol-phosphate transaminase [Desulfofarcimen acetoxidans]ACV61819.1 histidinol-phosphate aminotransferase [Desulfofarcimen acetoxidans DSM 771]
MSGRFPALETLVPPYIQRFEAYIPSKPDAVLKEMFGCNHLLRLNNNENAFGPSPAALEAIKSFNSASASIYPSGDAYFLRQRLGEATEHSSEAFIVGNGANEVIAFVIKAFCCEGDNIITADKTFAVYEWVAEFSGFEARLVPLVDYRFDPDAMLARMDGRTKIIFICNPNNPTGSYWNESLLQQFLDRVDGKCIVVLDEAYAEFIEKSDFPDGLSLIRKYPNLIVFRTFSKMFGLAALRIGYLVSNPKLADIIRRTSICYSVNMLAQVAAEASLRDAAFQISRTRAMINSSRKYICGELDRLGLSYIAGEGNFLMIRVPMSDTSVYRRLMQHGVMVRTMTAFRFPNYIRLTLAKLPAMEEFVNAMEILLKKRVGIQ